MRDEVHHRASSKIHQKTYSKQVEASLQKLRGTRSDAMPLPDKELLLCRARARDLYSTTLSQEDHQVFVSTSTRRKGKKRNLMAISGGAGMCSMLLYLF
jgi:hypothetical protein